MTFLVVIDHFGFGLQSNSSLLIPCLAGPALLNFAATCLTNLFRNDPSHSR